METQMTVYVDEIFNLLNFLLKNVIDFERKGLSQSLKILETFFTANTGILK